MGQVGRTLISNILQMFDLRCSCAAECTVASSKESLIPVALALYEVSMAVVLDVKNKHFGLGY